MKDRKHPGVRVMAEVIARWSFTATLSGWHDSFQNKLRVCWHIDRNRFASCHRRWTATKESSEHHFVNTFRQRSNGGKKQRRIGTNSDRNFQRLTHLLRLMIMETTAFLNLPV